MPENVIVTVVAGGQSADIELPIKAKVRDIMKELVRVAPMVFHGCVITADERLYYNDSVITEQSSFADMGIFDGSILVVR